MFSRWIASSCKAVYRGDIRAKKGRKERENKMEMHRKVEEKDKIWERLNDLP